MIKKLSLCKNDRKIKYILDKVFAGISICVLSPIMLVAAIGIKLSDNGPVLYKAKRMGKGMKPIIIYKFRTMYIGADKESSITGKHDNRIFFWGNILRKTKIDEIPQLFNILNGTMSIIGPRPEDIRIVKKFYTEEEKRTLDVLPGLACPGSIYNYTHGERYLQDNDTEEVYINDFLHIKLALDLYYLKNWTIWYDARIIFQTLHAILVTTLTKRQMGYPYEYRQIYGRSYNAKIFSTYDGIHKR